MTALNGSEWTKLKLQISYCLSSIGWTDICGNNANAMSIIQSLFPTNVTINWKHGLAEEMKFLANTWLQLSDIQCFAHTDRTPLVTPLQLIWSSKITKMLITLMRFTANIILLVWSLHSVFAKMCFKIESYNYCHYFNSENTRMCFTKLLSYFRREERKVFIRNQIKYDCNANKIKLLLQKYWFRLGFGQGLRDQPTTGRPFGFKSLLTSH